MRIYFKPQPNTENLRQQAQRRRRALVAAGCSTYSVECTSSNGREAILCLCCGLGSANANDIRQRYCGFCAEYHTEEVPDAWTE